MVSNIMYENYIECLTYIKNRSKEDNNLAYLSSCIPKGQNYFGLWLRREDGFSPSFFVTGGSTSLVVSHQQQCFLILFKR